MIGRFELAFKVKSLRPAMIGLFFAGEDIRKLVSRSGESSEFYRCSTYVRARFDVSRACSDVRRHNPCALGLLLFLLLWGGNRQQRWFSQHTLSLRPFTWPLVRRSNWSVLVIVTVHQAETVSFSARETAQPCSIGIDVPAGPIYAPST